MATGLHAASVPELQALLATLDDAQRPVGPKGRPTAAAPDERAKVQLRLPVTEPV